MVDCLPGEGRNARGCPNPRGFVHVPDTTKSFKIFGQFAESNVLEDFVPFVTSSMGFPSQSDYPGCHRLWCVRADAFATIRRFGVGTASPLSSARIREVATSLFPGTFGAILADNTPVPATSSLFKLEVTAASASGNYHFYMDLGQSATFFAENVLASVLAPEGSILNPADDLVVNVGEDDYFVDAIFAVSLAHVETQLPLQTVRFSERLLVGEGATTVHLRVPPLARRVKILQIQQAGGAALIATVERTIGDVDVGNITLAADFISTDASYPLGDETHLRFTNVMGQPAAIFNIIWEIQP